MNIFSEDDFLDAFGKAYFPEHKVEPEVFKLEGKFWRLPAPNSNKPITESTFIDFFEPLDDELMIAQSDFKEVPYISRASYQMVRCSDWFEQNLNQNFEAAPTTVWSDFESWDAFTQYVKQKRSNLFSDTRRTQRKLEQELGPLQFIFDDRRPEVLETCLRWKSEQWRSKGLPDRFANSEHVHLFRELAARGILLISSLSAKEYLLAIHIGMLDAGRLYSWVPAYNSVYSQYSPGRSLLHFLLEESFTQKHKEFDFLWGEEDYKWYYATHVRLVGDIGQRPYSKKLKHFLKTTLRPFPGVTKSLKQIRSKLLPLT